ncbi:MAG: hypothetical protein A2Y77_08920 [Planctomycetes bacterium RBG_13_62_9]|nr:MAG: hypothetical protein A2Y77_08920 [Planctomycetes bacterium RBG_13_62_9]
MEEQLLETAEEQDVDGSDAAKLVPVTESIRYRRRAQSAEKKAQTLTEQLAEASQKIAQMSQEVSGLQIEQKLTRRLAAAGAIDLETVLLVAKARMEGQSEADVDRCVEQLRKEKAHLFSGPVEAPASRKTAGAKDRAGQPRMALEQAATRAAKTGNRADLQHYLKLRRNVL